MDLQVGTCANLHIKDSRVGQNLFRIKIWVVWFRRPSPTKEATTWRTIDCPKEIEKTLLECNKQHFSQVQGAPFTVPPLSQEINFEASSAITDLILNTVHCMTQTHTRKGTVSEPLGVGDGRRNQTTQILILKRFCPTLLSLT